MSEGLTGPEIEALAEHYGVGHDASQLLAAAGLPKSEHPIVQSGSAKTFWREVSRLLHAGKVVDGRGRLLAKVREDIPNSAVFGPPGPGTANQYQQASAGATSYGPSPSGYASTNPSGYASTKTYSREALPYTILVMDSKGYSDRPMAIQQAWRDGFRWLVSSSAERANIRSHDLVVQDSGDGVMVGFPAGQYGVSRRQVVADFLPAFRSQLASFNLGKDELGRLRLRVGVHAADVVVDGPGFAGGGAVLVARLIDAPPARVALNHFPRANLAVILSDEMYRSTALQRLDGVYPEDYREVPVSVSVRENNADRVKFNGTGWLTVPGFDVVSLPLDAQDSTANGATSPSGSSAGSAGRTGGGASSSRPAPPPESVAEADPRRPPPLKDDEDWHFFVSYAEPDVDWARWITHMLQGDGYQVYLKANEEEFGDRHVADYSRALTGAVRTIVVLSPHYLLKGDQQLAWYDAFNRDPTGTTRRVLPVRVQECDPPALLAGIVGVDLFDLDDVAAGQLLLGKLRDALHGRIRPSQPPRFPGKVK